ncbi:MAG TPA: TIGR01212 family radical SAM protein [Ruminococcaceae bacterium]|nr:TIGR01212 family radical SAM protein [Oscillospiraceae bacterium]
MGFEFSDDNKRYHTLYYHNRHTYGKRVVKAVIDAGFTCPNIDGSKGTGGCFFCDGGSGYFTADSCLSVTEQLKREKERIYRKYPGAMINGYFQAHTNTYAKPDILEKKYREAISAGADTISIATRADCIDREKAELIASLGVPVTIELGLQTIHDETAARLNRCHSFKDFMSAYGLLHSYGIRVCVHIIDGLPGETAEMMTETAVQLGKLRPDAVKIHLLHVIKGTVMHGMYERGEYAPMSKEAYISEVIEQLRYLPPETVIERITGDGDRRTLIAPLWSRDKISVLGGIDKRMAELGIYQGDRFS